MKLLDYLKKESIICDLKSTDKQGVIEELIAAVGHLAGVENEELVHVLLERERLGSTGIGGGIGIPHGKLKSLETSIIGFGLSHKGVDFDAMDGRPTHIFFLLLTPESATDLHLRILARIANLLKDDLFKNSLLAASDRDEVYAVIQTSDVK